MLRRYHLDFSGSLGTPLAKLSILDAEGIGHSLRSYRLGKAPLLGYVEVGVFERGAGGRKP